LHVMVRDVHDSTRFCPSENFAKLQMLWQWENIFQFFHFKTRINFL
jgi:hypothetical protein